MKISERSWHYRLLRWLNSVGPMPKTLCEYMGVLCIVLPLWCISIVVLSPFIGAALFCSWIGRCRARRRFRKQGGIPLRREPSLVLEWLRAKKRRICPMIEYVP